MKDPGQFFISDDGKKWVSSPAERMVEFFLTKLRVKFFREVSFPGFGWSEHPYRFDFYIPKINTLIEYDGSHHFDNEEVMKKDWLKTQFCKEHGLRLVRLNKFHYPMMEKHLMRVLRLKEFRKKGIL